MPGSHPENWDKALAQLTDGKPALIWRRLVADTETPVSAALKLMVAERGDYLLESVQGGEVRGRYSLLGIDPDLVFRATGHSAEMNRTWQHDRDAFAPLPGDALGELRALVNACRIEVPEELPKALTVLVGYFGYETIGLVEKLPRAPQSTLELPDMLFVRPTLAMVFDRLTDDLWCIAPVWAEGTPEAQLEAASERIDNALRCLAAPASANTHNASLPVPQLAPVLPDGRYRDMVLKAKDYITAGDIFQVVLAQRFTTPFTLPAFSLYRALRRVNPSPFLYILDMPGFAAVGSSPEILVRVRDGEVTIRPIAGTRKRGRDRAEDAALAKDLLADPKEISEHLMLLDLGRNDVGRVAKTGTVKTTQQMHIENYSHVMHIVSNVVGELDPKYDALSALIAGFPAGTVSGAPKIRAMEIIDELEQERRSFYAGCIGYFSGNGNMDTAITLRTGLVKDGKLYVQAGGGIVAESNAEDEYQESFNKAKALMRAAEEAIKFI